MSTVGASSTHIVGRFADMPSGTARRVDLDGVAVAVVRIDGHAIGRGSEGPVTRQVREAYHALTRGADTIAAEGGVP